MQNKTFKGELVSQLLQHVMDCGQDEKLPRPPSICDTATLEACLCAIRGEGDRLLATRPYPVRIFVQEPQSYLANASALQLLTESEGGGKQEQDRVSSIRVLDHFRYDVMQSILSRLRHLLVCDINCTVSKDPTGGNSDRAIIQLRPVRGIAPSDPAVAEQLRTLLTNIKRNMGTRPFVCQVESSLGPERCLDLLPLMPPREPLYWQCVQV